jgi:hypothetical protein
MHQKTSNRKAFQIIPDESSNVSGEASTVQHHIVHVSRPCQYLLFSTTQCFLNLLQHNCSLGTEAMGGGGGGGVGEAGGCVQ